MSFFTPGEEFTTYDLAEKETLPLSKDEIKQEKELEKGNEPEKKGKSGIPDWKLPEVEPLENIFVTRRDWGAGPHIEGHEYLVKPILFVRFWKYTDTQSCANKEMCKKVVKEIQERHKERGFGDITHNFLLGGDGNVYEGRGWDFKAPKDTRYKHDRHSYIDVAFIGDERRGFGVYYDAAYELFDHGFTNKFIDQEYFNVEWGQETMDLSMKQIAGS